MKHLWSGVAVGWLLLVNVRVSAQEWTRFRGPNGSGISSATTIPVTITEADYNWRVALPGSGVSSPVIWGQKIFVTSADGEQGKRYLLCLSAEDGRTLWMRTYDFTKYPVHELTGFASSTPAVDADFVYVIWTEPSRITVHALDHNGNEIWQRNLGRHNVRNGGATSPIMVGDVVIVVNEQEERDPAEKKVGPKPKSFLIGLDRKTGKTLWKRPRKTSNVAPYATPAIYQPPDGPPEVIFSSTAHGITSLDPQTGKLNWEISGIFKVRCVASPVVAHGLIFQTSGSGGGEKRLVAVRPGSKKPKRPAELVYEIPRDISYVPTPIVYGDYVFCWGDGGIVTCLRAKTGELVWRARVGGTYYGSPVCVNGKLYAMNTQGELVVIEASDQFKILGRSNLGEGSLATPAVADGVMYLRTMSHLISVGGKPEDGAAETPRPTTNKW